MRAGLIAALASMFVLGGCGFRPLYAESTGVSQTLAAVEVETGQGRLAFLLREQLNRRFGAGEDEPEYRLEVTPALSRQGFGLRIDDVATRFELVLTARYDLRRIDNNASVQRGSVQTKASFDLPGDPYADLVAEEAARERAAAQAAEEIRTILAITLAEAAEDA